MIKHFCDVCGAEDPINRIKVRDKLFVLCSNSNALGRLEADICIKCLRDAVNDAYAESKRVLP